MIVSIFTRTYIKNLKGNKFHNETRIFGWKALDTIDRLSRAVNEIKVGYELYEDNREDGCRGMTIGTYSWKPVGLDLVISCDVVERTG